MARALCGGSISSSHRATWPAACSATTAFRRASCRDRCALVHIFPSLRSQADHPLTRNQMGIRRRGALKQALSEQLAPRCVAIGIIALVDQFGFQRAEETLHRCIVPAIALAAH